MHFNRKKHAKTLFLALIVTNTALAGCLGANESDEETLRIAFSVRDDYTSFDENPQKLADYLSEELGRNVEFYPITSDALALQALRFGSADMAFMDGGAAWMGWQQYGLEAMAADQKSDGRTYYNAHAYVLNDSAAAQAMNDDDDTTAALSPTIAPATRRGTRDGQCTRRRCTRHQCTRPRAHTRTRAR